MGTPYDVFTEAFFHKLTEHKFVSLGEEASVSIADTYMKRACAEFSANCGNIGYDLTRFDDDGRFFLAEIKEKDLPIIVDIVSNGMVVQWLKTKKFDSDNYENILSTHDFSYYSPAQLLKEVSNAYNEEHDRFVNDCRRYSYRKGDLTTLHL